MTVASGFLGSWAAKKFTDAAWNRLYGYFRPDSLCKEIDSALKSDLSIKALYESAPTLDRDRLTPERVRALIQFTVAGGGESLKDYLVNEQLVDLPLRRKGGDGSFDSVWHAVAAALTSAVEAAIVRDDTLSRLFNLAAHQLDHLRHQTVLEQLQSVRSLIESQASSVQGSEPGVGGYGSHAAHSPGMKVSDDPALRAIKLLAEQNEGLEQQLREQLDSNTERLWDEIVEELRSGNVHAAISKGESLERRLQTLGGRLSAAVRGRAYLLLAQLALAESSEWGTLADEFVKARSLVEKAREAFGDDISDENSLRLLGVKAKIAGSKGRYDEASELLEGRTDPQSVSTRLVILIGSGGFAEAATLVQSLPLDEKWCDHATFVHARLGATCEAETAIQWSHGRGDAQLEARCRIAFARGVLTRLTESRIGSVVSPLTVGGGEAAEIEDVLAKVAPIVSVCRARDGVRNGLEADAVAFAYMSLWLLRRPGEAREHARLLRDHRPVHLEFAKAVLRRDADPIDGLSDMLCTDYPRYFNAHEVALALDIEGGLRPEAVLDRIDALRPLASEAEERETLGKLIAQAVGASADDTCDRADNLAAALLGPEHPLNRLLGAIRHLKRGDHAGAERILDGLADESDNVVGQFRAQLLARQGKHAEAAELLERIGRRMSDPDVLKAAADLALDAKPRRLDVVVRVLEDALVVDPNDLRSNHNLAVAYVELQGFARAAECLQRICALQPSDLNSRMRLARCLELANRPREALEAYDVACGSADAPLQAYLARAMLLSNIGRPGDAFATLHAARERWWNDPAFAAVYMNIAHAADQDRYADEGFKQLWALRESGKAPPEVLQPHSLEDLMTLTSEDRKQRDFLHDQLLVGKLPWLFVERLLGNVPYWGWRIRTQPLLWHSDDARSRASFSVYATNGYAVLLVDGTPSLRQISCPARGTPVVADLSALITLHRLGLLAEGLDYFGRVRIPPDYLSEVIRESGRLRPHQLSQLTALERVKALLDQKKVRVLAQADADENLCVVDEYGEEEACYRVADLLDALKEAGRLRPAEVNEARRVAHAPSKGPATGRALRRGDQLLIDLTTLEVLAGHGLHGIVADSFSRVFISASDFDRLTQELRRFDLLAETQRWHDELWMLTIGNPRVDATTPMVGPEVRVDAGEEDDEVSDGSATPRRISAISAALLAQHEKLPLLVDDRVCQNTVLRANGTEDSAGFGTDRLVLALSEAGHIDGHRAADALLQLIGWRYRFLVVPPSVLRTIADEYAEHDLRKVALYAHDCMRDPGLFGGPEPTDPPLPIAFRFYQDWLRAIAEFTAELWLGESPDEARAERLTDWAMAEFVPTVPSALGSRVGRLANFSATTVLHFAMLRFCDTQNYRRTNRALRRIARGLGLSDEDFVHAAADIIDSHG